jgi:hypothetical protein
MDQGGANAKVTCITVRTHQQHVPPSDGQNDFHQLIAGQLRFNHIPGQDEREVLPPTPASVTNLKDDPSVDPMSDDHGILLSDFLLALDGAGFAVSRALLRHQCLFHALNTSMNIFAWFNKKKSIKEERKYTVTLHHNGSFTIQITNISRQSLEYISANIGRDAVYLSDKVIINLQEFCIAEVVEDKNQVGG